MSRAADQPRVLTGERPRGAAGVVQLICLLLTVACLASLARTAIRPLLAGAPDFEYFYKAGWWLLERGTLDPHYDLTAAGQPLPRGGLDWYLPFVPRLMTLLAWLPLPRAGVAWLSLNLLALAATMCWVGRDLLPRPGPGSAGSEFAHDKQSFAVGARPAAWFVIPPLALLLLGVFWYWEFRLNQVNTLTLALLVMSFVAWQRGGRAMAGFWLGLAVLIKIAPLLVVGWFGLKRQYRTVAAAALTIVLAGPVADTAVFGAREAVGLYADWMQRAGTQGSHRGLILSQTEMDWRNQGLGAVLSRWLHPTSYALRWDNDPRLPAPGGTKRINLLNLPRGSVANVTLLIQAAALLGLIWLARRPAAGLPLERIRLEWALCLAAMLWFMPVMRAYHLVWLFPLAALMCDAVGRFWQWRRWSLLGLAGLAGLVLAQALARDERLEAGGLLLAAVLLLCAPAIVLIARLGRRPVPAGGPAPPLVHA